MRPLAQFFITLFLVRLCTKTSATQDILPQRRKGAKKVQRNAATLSVFAPLRKTSSRNNALFVQSILLLLAGCTLSSALAFQKPGGREPVKPTPTPAPAPTPAPVRPGGPTRPGSNGRDKPIKLPVRLAKLTIIAPPGSRIWIDATEVDLAKTVGGVLLLDRRKVKTSYTQGVITLDGLEPRTYNLRAYKPDFQEYAKPVDVFLDQENVFSIALTPIPGRLTVAPSVGGADVEIVNLESNTSIGRYSERLERFELAPGRYRVLTSRAGYRNAVREIVVNPGESVYLEPLLELLPRPSPTPTPRAAAFTAPMSFDVQRQAPYLIFRIRGSSGDATKTVGTINITLGGPGRNYVTGNLNGLPCRIEFIKLANIAEGSIVEAPGPSNNWSSMVVRVRLKDEKRWPTSFAINWNSLENSRPAEVSGASPIFVPAEATRRIQPEYPLAARSSPVSATVLVLVAIDSNGSVVSAKATDGPFVFRRSSEDAARKWKFRPAMRNGQAVESELTIQFQFEP